MTAEDFKTSITPMPIPMEVGVHGGTIRMPDGERGFVRLAFATAQGVSMFFVPVETVKELADTLLKEAQQTMSGLIVPKKGIVVPIPKMDGDNGKGKA